MNGSMIRKIGLVAFIGVYSLSVLSSAMMGQWFFFWTLVAMGLCVGVGEVVSVIVTKKTLSTNITRAWKEGGKKAVWATIMCVSLILTMVTLMIHFFPWEWVVG